MTRDEFIQSNVYLGKLLYIDESTNQLWTEELISVNSKKGKALLKVLPKGGAFKKSMVIKLITKDTTDDFNLGLGLEEK